MTSDQWIRRALWLAVIYNLVGVVLFLPVAFGRPLHFLPLQPPRFYAAQMGFIIAFGGATCAWLARQAQIDRPLVVVAAAGKLGSFLLFVVYCTLGDVPWAAIPFVVPDFIFATIFLRWIAVTSPRRE